MEEKKQEQKAQLTTEQYFYLKNNGLMIVVPVDEETGLYDLQIRQFNPTTGQELFRTNSSGNRAPALSVIFDVSEQRRIKAALLNQAKAIQAVIDDVTAAQPATEPPLPIKKSQLVDT